MLSDIFSMMKYTFLSNPNGAKLQSFFSYSPIGSRQSAAFLFFFAVASGLFAQATQPALLVQGALTQSDGTAVGDTLYSITFKLWTELSGGIAEHTETIPNIQTVGGVYSVVLGMNGTPITAPFDRVYYLGVTINGKELLTRPLLTHAPYALSLLGKSNKFPISGLVKADAVHVTGLATVNRIQVITTATVDTFNVNGPAKAAAFVAQSGMPAMGTARKGYSFDTGGDTDGGLFSTADKTVSVFTNASERLKVSQNQIELKAKVLTLNDFAGGGYAFISNKTSGLFGTDGTQVAVRFEGDDRINMSSDSITRYNGTWEFNSKVWLNNIVTTTESEIEIAKTIDIRQDITYPDYSPLGGKDHDDSEDETEYHQYLASGVTKFHINSGKKTFEKISLRVASRMLADGYYAASDRRIKKDFSRVNTAEALANLLRLQVTGYHYKDEIANGSNLQMGFIAQEVEAVEPESITTSTDFIPSVNAPAANIRSIDQRLVFSMCEPHDLQKGDRVRIIEGWVQHNVTVEEATETEFRVANWGQTVPTTAFVLGKEVSDYKAVDYDHLFTMNIAATQELARRAETLEKALSAAQSKNAALRAENTSLEKAQTAFEGQLSELDKNMKLLEITGSNR